MALNGWREPRPWVDSWEATMRQADAKNATGSASHREGLQEAADAWNAPSWAAGRKDLYDRLSQHVGASPQEQADDHAARDENRTRLVQDVDEQRQLYRAEKTRREEELRDMLQRERVAREHDDANVARVEQWHAQRDAKMQMLRRHADTQPQTTNAEARSALGFPSTEQLYAPLYKENTSDVRAPLKPVKDSLPASGLNAAHLWPVDDLIGKPPVSDYQPLGPASPPRSHMPSAEDGDGGENVDDDVAPSPPPDSPEGGTAEGDDKLISTPQPINIPSGEAPAGDRNDALERSAATWSKGMNLTYCGYSNWTGQRESIAAAADADALHATIDLLGDTSSTFVAGRTSRMLREGKRKQFPEREERNLVPALAKNNEWEQHMREKLRERKTTYPTTEALMRRHYQRVLSRGGPHSNPHLPAEDDVKISATLNHFHEASWARREVGDVLSRALRRPQVPPSSLPEGALLRRQADAPTLDALQRMADRTPLQLEVRAKHMPDMEGVYILSPMGAVAAWISRSGRHVISLDGGGRWAVAYNAGADATGLAVEERAVIARAAAAGRMDEMPHEVALWEFRVPPVSGFAVSSEERGVVVVLPGAGGGGGDEDAYEGGGQAADDAAHEEADADAAAADAKVAQALGDGGGWVERRDPKTRRAYYLERGTGKTVWDLREHLTGLPTPGLRPPLKRIAPANPPTTRTAAAVASGEWTAKYDPHTQREYYVHARTKKTVWNLERLLHDEGVPLPRAAQPPTEPYIPGVPLTM